MLTLIIMCWFLLCFRKTPGCYTFKFEYDIYNVTVALANSEPMDIIQIESLAKSPHKDRREMAKH